MNLDQKWLPLGLGALVLFCACVGLVCIASGGLAFLRWVPETSGPTTGHQSTQVITVEALTTPAETPGPPAANREEEDPPLELDAPNIPGVSLLTGSEETLETLLNEIVPINDPLDLAQRLEGKVGIPEVVPESVVPVPVGTERLFWATNTDTNENFQINATLRYASDHLYFWIENGVAYNERDLERLGNVFDTQIYPTNREFLGSEWSPGIDNDPHLYMLYTTRIGGSVAGYYSASDQYHPDARKYSNAHEIFFISADLVNLGSEAVEGVIAHEFQHMIHWHQDRNEEVWISEGFSELAMFLNGYSTGGTEHSYVRNPDVQLNTWPASSNTYPHYGASFLFMAYFLDRFGDEATKAIVAHPENGLKSIDEVLRSIGAVDPRTGGAIDADDIFADWVVTSYLNDINIEDGRYSYQRYENAPQPGDTEVINTCADNWETRDVRQYAVDYIRIRCRGDFTLRFEGAEEAKVFPADPYSGEYVFWSNKGDESNMTLTREFDFSQISGPLTLIYQTWYDLEEDYDYLFLVASEDGETWQILRTPSGTDENPSGNSYGWGYNGASGAWIEEQVDVSQFAGKQVQIRFEYITDMAVNGEGFLLDDVRISEINYSEDFEVGEGGWQAEGFVRIKNQLPQSYQISIIRNGRTISVETVELGAGERASIPLRLGGEVHDAVLVVSGTTRFTTQPAEYRFRFD